MTTESRQILYDLKLDETPFGIQYFVEPTVQNVTNSKTHPNLLAKNLVSK
jgi:hypothetical protein